MASFEEMKEKYGKYWAEYLDLKEIDKIKIREDEEEKQSRQATKIKSIAKKIGIEYITVPSSYHRYIAHKGMKAACCDQDVRWVGYICNLLAGDDEVIRYERDMLDSSYHAKTNDDYIPNELFYWHFCIYGNVKKILGTIKERMESIGWFSEYQALKSKHKNHCDKPWADPEKRY